MRVSVIALAASLAVAAGLRAQNGSAGAAAGNPPAAAANNARLDAYLMNWEKKMREVQTLSAVLARIDKDKAFGTTTKYVGSAQYLKSGNGPTVLNQAHLELKQEGKQDVADKFICTGTYLYQFLPSQKEIRAYEMPKPKAGQVSEDSFLGFLFGMKADEARKRYVLTLAKEDNWYVYVEVTPRFPADRAEFSRARLVLNKDNFLPRQLWFEHPNHNEVTWDIPRIQAGVDLDRRMFDAPRVPQGWKLVPVPRQTSTGAPNGVPPRVARPTKPDGQ